MGVDGFIFHAYIKRKESLFLEQIAYSKYRLKNIDKEKLKSIGFYYDKSISGTDDEYYSYRFPVYKDSNRPLLTGMVSIDTKDGSLLINVYKTSSKDSYAPFYQTFYGNYHTILNIINQNILSELRKIRIEHYE